MEMVINLHIEKLPEGLWLATSDDLKGLVAQGRTVNETLEIARDVARKLIEAGATSSPAPSLPTVPDTFDFSVVVGA